MRKIYKKKKIIFVILLILILIFSGFVWLQLYHKKNQQSFEEMMMLPTWQLNRTANQMISREIRFDSGEVLPNKVFVYYHTFIDADSSTLDVEGIRKLTEPVLLQRVKTDPDPILKILRDNKATVIYLYRDEHGNILFKFSFTPDQYEK